MVDVGAVLGHENLPLAGVLVLVGELDFVIGLGGDGAFIVKVPSRVLINQKPQFHAADVLEGQLAHIVIEHIHLGGGLEGFVQSRLDDVKEGLVVLHPAPDGVAGVLQVPHIELEVLRNHAYHIGGGLVGVDIGVLVFEVVELVIYGDLDDVIRAALAGFLKDKAIKDGGAVHGKTARVALLKAQAGCLDHLGNELSRLSLAFPLNAHILHHGGQHDGPLVLYQQLIGHGMVSTCPT